MHSLERELPADTAALGLRLFKPDNRYRVIGERLEDIVRDEDFADLYEPTGREAVSPALLALVTLFQFLENVPDREAAELVVVRLDWKYALHLPLGDTGFHYSVLCYFRRRLIEHEAERRVFEAVLERLKELGLVKKRGKQRTDAIAVLGAVRELSALETATETLRLVVRAAEQQAPEWTEQTLGAEFREQYGHTKPDYRLSAAEREQEMAATGTAGARLLAALDTAPAGLAKQEVVQTLRLVWAQRFVVGADGSVGVRKDVPDCTELVVTPHDTGVRAGAKRGKHWHGEKTHVTETAEADQPNFIVDVTTANAASGDVVALPEVHQAQAQADLLPGEHYVDSGYVSAAQLAASAELGITLMGPPLADTTPNQFKIAAFRLDYDQRVATCPEGKESVKWSRAKQRDGSQATYIEFDAKDCQPCPLRAQCTQAAGGRSLRVSEHYALLAARRAEAETAAFWEKMRARPAIEATLSELVRAHGFRRHRYRGDRKRHFENLLKAAACNLKRLAKLLAATPQPTAQPIAA